jgi:hypothetical protein
MPAAPARGARNLIMCMVKGCMVIDEFYSIKVKGDRSKFHLPIVRAKLQRRSLLKENVV